MNIVSSASRQTEADVAQRPPASINSAVNSGHSFTQPEAKSRIFLDQRNRSSPGTGFGGKGSRTTDPFASLSRLCIVVILCRDPAPDMLGIGLSGGFSKRSTCRMAPTPVVLYKAA